jgi:mannose-6-phosphate isomerase-like protein (cupin superfamily)
MAKSELEKYLRKAVSNKPYTHPEVTAPSLEVKSDKDFGNLNFSLGTVAISEPFLMVSENHAHDFDQFLMFVGGDATNMPDLGGEVEITLSKDGKKMEKFTITEATVVYIPACLYHCPLNFKKVNNPKYPIIFKDLMFTSDYKRIPNKPTKKK